MSNKKTDFEFEVVTATENLEDNKEVLEQMKTLQNTDTENPSALDDVVESLKNDEEDLITSRPKQKKKSPFKKVDASDQEQTQAPIVADKQNLSSVTSPKQFDSSREDLVKKVEKVTTKPTNVEPEKLPDPVEGTVSQVSQFTDKAKQVSDTSKQHGAKAKRNLETPVWELIKSRQFSVFALPPQAVSYYFKCVAETLDSATLTFSNAAVANALESFLKKEFTVEFVDKRKVIVKKL